MKLLVQFCSILEIFFLSFIIGNIYFFEPFRKSAKKCKTGFSHYKGNVFSQENLFSRGMFIVLASIVEEFDQYFVNFTHISLL